MSNPNPNLQRRQVNPAAVNLLVDNISALPHDEYGIINLLPFAHDSDAVRLVKRHFCEAIVNLLASHGHMSDNDDAEAVPGTVVVDLKCRDCGTTFTQVPVDDGVAMLNASMFITQTSQLNTQCPHTPTTLEDMRAHMERQFYATTCSQCGVADAKLTDGVCGLCIKNQGGQQL